MQIIIILVVLAIGATSFLFFNKNNSQAVQESNLQKQEVLVDENSTIQKVINYKNGNYSATGLYTSPAGSESVKIDVELKDDVIISSNFVGEATNKGSIFNQGKFKEGFQAFVVGKKIDEVNLNVVNGSSLTPKGFMDGLAKIKLEAKI